MDILIPVSAGELFDKISILEIKSERITSEERLVHVRNELRLLQEVVKAHDLLIPDDLYLQLKNCNTELWTIEDYIREKEEKAIFDEDFIKYARLDAQLNDKRFVIKRSINDHFSSAIVEHKSNIIEQKSYKESTLTRKVILK